MFKSIYNLLYIKLLIISFMIIVSGCKTKKGCLVETFDNPSSILASGKCYEIKKVYFSKDYVNDPGKFLSEKDYELIEGIVKEKLSELHYMNYAPIPPESDPNMGDFFHLMHIKINYFNIEVKKYDLIIRKDFYLGFDISIDQISVKEIHNCKSINYGRKKFSIENSLGNGFNTLSDELFKSKYLKAAIQDIFSEFIPTQAEMIRRVKPEYNVITQLLDQSPPNCEKAIKILQEKKNEHRKYIYFYNLGVAYECRANKTFDQSKKLIFLQEAQNSYDDASKVNPKDNEIQKALTNVTNVIKIHRRAIENQKK